MTEKDLEIQELKQRIRKMEKELEGYRQMVPCMPGTIIYRIGGSKKKPVVIACEVRSVEIDEYGRTALKLGWNQDRYEAVAAHRLGETWWLKRDEAVEAMEGM